MPYLIQDCKQCADFFSKPIDGAATEV